MCQSQSPNLFPPAYPLVTRDHSTPGSSVLHCVPKFAQVHCSIKLVMLSNHLIFCCPLLLLPSIFPSIRVFSNKLDIHVRWPKFWSFSFSVSPSNEYSGLISFSIDWLDLIAVQGTLNSLLQHHSSKASILWGSVFFMVQLSHLYMTTGKTIALTILTFKTCNILWSPRIQRSNTWMPIKARCLDLEHCVESSPQLYKLVLWGFYFSLYIVKNKATGPKWNHLC